MNLIRVSRHRYIGVHHAASQVYSNPHKVNLYVSNNVLTPLLGTLPELFKTSRVRKHCTINLLDPAIIRSYGIIVTTNLIRLYMLNESPEVLGKLWMGANSRSLFDIVPEFAKQIGKSQFIEWYNTVHFFQ